jgi:hypothetical protein
MKQEVRFDDAATPEDLARRSEKLFIAQERDR